VEGRNRRLHKNTQTSYIKNTNTTGLKKLRDKTSREKGACSSTSCRDSTEENRVMEETEGVTEKATWQFAKEGAGP
jgi:hypothetical protein